MRKNICDLSCTFEFWVWFQTFCAPFNRDGTHRAIVVVAKKSSCVWRCVITFTFEKGHIHQLEGGHLLVCIVVVPCACFSSIVQVLYSYMAIKERTIEFEDWKFFPDMKVKNILEILITFITLFKFPSQEQYQCHLSNLLIGQY